MFKRKKENPLSYEEKLFNSYIDDLREEKNLLLAKTENVITKKGVIDLYPEGSDKSKAIQDLEQAQHTLLCAIGAYDSVRCSMICYYKEHYKGFRCCYTNPNNYATSHDLIEFAYKHYFKSHNC